MGFYSFVVWAEREVPVREGMVLLEPGSNTFNAVVKDIEAFKKRLEEEGVRLDKCIALDEFDSTSIPLTADLLPSEVTGIHNGTKALS